MKEKMILLNEKLIERERKIPHSTVLRKKLKEHGDFIHISQMSKTEILDFSKSKGLMGVDGSYMTMGETFPNILFLAQAIAKSTNAPKETVRNVDIFSGLLDGGEEDINEYSKKVAEMEVQVALQGLEKFNPFAVFLDGGFWRLTKNCTNKGKNLWNKFSKLCIEGNHLLVGVIEDVGSYELCDKIELETVFHDRDLMFGILGIGEVYFLKEPYKGDFLKVFARFSKDPMSIACDFLPQQKDSVLNMLKFIYSLTPINERGIPLWCDIVDKEVKITKEMACSIVSSYIDPVLQEKILTGKRNRRSLF